MLVGNNGEFKYMTMESDGKEIPITYWEDKVIDGTDECILKVKNYNSIDELKYFIILGKPFTDNHYIAIDLDNMRIGFVADTTYPSYTNLNHDAPQPTPPQPIPPTPPSSDTYAVTMPLVYNNETKRY